MSRSLKSSIEEDVDMTDVALITATRSLTLNSSRPAPIPAAAAPTAPPIPHAITYPAVTLYVGSQRQKLVVPAPVLTKSSTWFARAVNDNATIFHLSDEDLQDMNLFLDFLQDGRYKLPREDSAPTRNFHGSRLSRTYSKLADRFPACRFHVHRRHVKMYMLGERFEVPALRTYAFDMLYELLEAEDAAAIWGFEESEVFVEERLRLIITLYRNPRMCGRQLRKLFAFKAAETWSLYMECLENGKEYKKRVALVDLMATVPEFIHDILMLLADSRTTLLALGKNGFFDIVELQSSANHPKI